MATPQAQHRRTWLPVALLGLALLILLAPAARPDPDPDAFQRLRERHRAREQEGEKEFRLLIDRARHLLDTRNYGEARSVLRRAALLRPDDATCRDLLAQAHAALATTTPSPKPHPALQRVKAKRQFLHTTLLRQLDQGLFEAQQALQAGKHDEARLHAQRVLYGCKYLNGTPRAEECRTRANAILAAADTKRPPSAAAERQAILDAKREEARAASEETLRELCRRGWRHHDNGHYAKALAVAEQILSTAPRDERALHLQTEARRAKEEIEGRGARKAERKQTNLDHLVRLVEKELTLPKDIGKAKVFLPAKARRAPHPLVRERPMEPWEHQLRKRLREKVTFEFKETTLPEACRCLAELSSSTILVDPHLAKSPDRITLPKMNLRVEHALKWLCRRWRAIYVVRDHAILITTRAGRLNEPVLDDYDISGLLMPLRTIRTVLDGSVQFDDTRPTRTLVASAKPDEPKTPPVDKDAIGAGWARFIQSSVAPESWEAPGKGATLQEGAPRYSISYRNGRIVVVHTPEVHEQIASLLSNYRQARNLQVHVQARFLNIEMDFLHEIGVDFPGSAGADAADPTDDTYGYLDPREDPPINPDRPTQRWEIAANIEHQHGLGEIPEGLQVPPGAGGLSVTYQYLNHASANAILTAVVKGRRGTVLIAPRLTCFNTQRANFQALTNYNYVRSISSDEEPEIGNVPDGIIFDVQPFISSDHKYITLVLQPQLRTLRALQSFAYIEGWATSRAVQLPLTELSSVATTVTVPDGGSLIVGGLSRVTEQHGTASLPFIHAIPAVKYLFRDWQDNERRVSLIIMVNAEIIPDIFREE